MLSIILLSYFSSNRLCEVYTKLSVEMKIANVDFELVIIDDGSTDNSFEVAKELESKSKNIRAYQLSRNFGSNYAIFAGLSLCSGKCATVIPDDEQQPYSTIIEMYNIWKNGKKIIIPYRERRNDGFINGLYSSLYYKVMNKFSCVTYPKGGSDVFLIDREIIDIINNDIRPVHTAVISEILRLGFSPYYFGFQRPKSDNKSRWTFKKKFKLFMDTFISSSALPIKLISISGLFFSFCSFVLIIFYLYVKIFGNSKFWGINIHGWTSIVLFIIFFSGLILLSLGVIAEYIWRIYEEVKGRPGFIIKKRNGNYEPKSKNK